MHFRIPNLHCHLMDPAAGLKALLNEDITVEKFLAEVTEVPQKILLSHPLVLQYYEKKPLHIQRGENGQSYYRDVRLLY